MHSLDLSVFYFLYGLAGNAHWIDICIVFIGKYLLYPLLLVVAFFMYQAWRTGRTIKLWGYYVAVLGALVARFGVAEAIRLVYHHPRPFVTLHLPHLLTDTSYSFPSGHTIFIFALATGVYRINKKLGWWLYWLGLLIGLARVAGGVHYPSDIAGGAILGVITGLLVHVLWRSLSKSINIPSI